MSNNLKPKHIKVTKISPENEGLKEGYYVKGFLLKPLEAGDMILVARYERNGVEVDGLFQSSVIESFCETNTPCSDFGAMIEKKGAVVKTENSTYKIDYLD